MIATGSSKQGRVLVRPDIPTNKPLSAGERETAKAKLAEYSAAVESVCARPAPSPLQILGKGFSEAITQPAQGILAGARLGGFTGRVQGKAFADDATWNKSPATNGAAERAAGGAAGIGGTLVGAVGGLALGTICGLSQLINAPFRAYSAVQQDAAHKRHFSELKNEASALLAALDRTPAGSILQ